MTKYYTGGGTPQASGDAKLFIAEFLGGFPDDYEFVDIEDGGYISKGDPYWRFGDVGGDKLIEIGMWDNFKIQITEANGIQGWDENSSTWIDLLQKTEAHILATIGPHTGTLPWTDLDKTDSSLVDLSTRPHSALSDAPTSAHHVRYADSEVENVITAELVDGESIDNAIDALIGAITHNSLQELNAGDNYEHITQAQKDALHSIYTLEEHNNDYHNPNYEVEFSKNSAFNKNFGTVVDTVTQGNDSRLQDAYKIEGADIDLTGLATNKILKYDGSKWIVSDDDSGEGYSEAEINTLFAIGSANKRWKNLILEGGDENILMLLGEYTTIASGDAIFAKYTFGIPLDYIIGTHNLVITRLKVGLVDADTVGDWIMNMKIRSWIGFATSVEQRADATDYKAPQVITWDFADLTVGGVFERIAVCIDCIAQQANDLEFSYVKIEYYYTS